VRYVAPARPETAGGGGPPRHDSVWETKSMSNSGHSSDDRPPASATSDDSGVTTITDFQPKAGSAERLEDSLHAWTRAMMTFEGCRGVSVLRPDPPSQPAFRVICQYEGVPRFHAWEASEHHERLLAAARETMDGPPRSHVIPGLEAWFTASSDDPARLAPTRLKMTVVMFLGMFPLSYLVHVAFGVFPEFGHLSHIVDTALVTAVVVGLMTYLAMPILTRLLAFWIYPNASAS
jgi:antibiotic biosynthesis monooxygenase (ABM) superfamily enzyme